MFKKPFALEEAYVTIFEEYSPFWCAPIVPGSRKVVNAAGGVWQLTYDLSFMPAGMIIPGRQDKDTSGNLLPQFTVRARWKDLYMTDLHWDRPPVENSHIPTGLPHEYTETVGFAGTLGFNAAHVGENLWEMAGFRRFYRVFVDVKRSPAAPVERSWELRGASVSGNSMASSGGPIGIARAFKAKEFPEADALYTLAYVHRGHMRAEKTTNNINLAIISLGQPYHASLLPTGATGGYDLTISYDGAGKYAFRYNTSAILTGQAWASGREIVLDGNEAGRIRIRLGAAPPSLDAVTKTSVSDRIQVY